MGEDLHRVRAIKEQLVGLDPIAAVVMLADAFVHGLDVCGICHGCVGGLLVGRIRSTSRDVASILTVENCMDSANSNRERVESRAEKFLESYNHITSPITSHHVQRSVEPAPQPRMQAPKVSSGTFLLPKSAPVSQ